ncbi:hypothetical protein AKO1_010611 [Acrasis kona]|uniref:Guanylate cyclase n=1 Tax=Acrasis kona TaxID=1008807 RepID=A0AAW2ZIV1_9EUKA
MGVSNKDGYVDNYFTWPGFTAVNQLQHYPLDSDFKWNPPAAYVGRSTFQTGIWSKLRVNPTPNSGNGVLAVAKCKQVNGLRDCPIFITYGLGVQNATTKSINYVASIAFIASALSDDLQEFVTSLPNSAMMIIEKNTGNILGSSDPNHIITANNGSELVPAQNYNNSMLASAAAYLRSNYGNDYAGITQDGVNQQQFRFYDAKSNKYVFGTFKLVFDPSGIQWINVVVVPEVSLIGDYLVTLIVVVVVLVVVLIMFLVLGGFFAAWITRPLTSLAREMKLVQNMNLDRIKPQQSHFGELITIQSAFMSMVDRLKSYKAFLPGHILQRDYGYDETELDQTPEPSKQQVEVIDSDPKMFDLGVNKKNITMMVITITNSESTIEQHGEDLSDYQAYHGALLTMVSEAVNKNKGHIDSFDQSHFVACWGTGAAARNGSEQDAVNALTACETILNRIKMFKDDSTVSAVTNPIRISVCSGVAFVGNMGNYNKRLLCLFGPVCVVSDAVCDASEKLGLSVVVDDATCNLVGNQFSTHQVGTVVIDQRVVVIRQLVLGEKSNVYNDFVYQRSKLIKSE